MRASQSAAALILGGSKSDLVGIGHLKTHSLNGLGTLTRPRSAGRLITPRKELSAGLKPRTLVKHEFHFAQGGHGMQFQNLIVTGVKGQAKSLGVQIGWRIYMIDGILMDSGTQAWQKLQDAQWQWRTVSVVFFTDYRAIRMEEKIKEEEEERREVERLAKLPFTSTNDEKHLEQLKQEFIFQGYIERVEDRAVTLEQLLRVVEFSKEHCHRWRDTRPSHMSRSAGRKVHIDHMNWCHLNAWLVGPATAEKDCSLLELLTNQEQPPAFYLIHFWGDLVLNLIEAIRVHMQSRNVEETSAYWMGLFANRPHSLQDAFCPDLKSTCFHKAMAACDFRVMLAIDPKNDSSLMATCLSRLWCLYELAICNEPNCQLDLIQTKLDVRAPLKKASMVSHFLTKEEQEAELRAPTSGYKAQSDREKSFSLTTMDLALHVSIAKARITNETERRQILNSLARREPTEEVVEEHPEYGLWNKRLRAMFALCFWRRVMGGNVSDSDVHRTQLKLGKGDGRPRGSVNSTKAPQYKPGSGREGRFNIVPPPPAVTPRGGGGRGAESIGEDVDSLAEALTSFPPGTVKLQYSLCCEVPAACVGLLVGAGGELIRQAEQASGAKIEIERSQGDSRTMTLVGTLLNIYLGHAIMMSRLQTFEQEQEEKEQAEQLGREDFREEDAQEREQKEDYFRDEARDDEVQEEREGNHEDLREEDQERSDDADREEDHHDREEERLEDGFVQHAEPHEDIEESDEEPEVIREQIAKLEEKLARALARRASE